jgi:peptidoglycan-associated lipoprotein
MDTGTRPLIRRQMRHTRFAVIAILIVAVGLGACAKKKPPVARPLPAPPPTTPQPLPNRPPAPPEPVPETTPIPPEPTISDDPLTKDLDTINKNSPFQPVFFALDSYEVDSGGQAALNTNAGILKKYPAWIITIEGHCDERGTAEYNLALGEKRALAAKTYLVSLGVPADRVRTVSYGKEFPFDPGHDEGAWSKNRRAHFVVTSK